MAQLIRDGGSIFKRLQSHLF